MVALRCVDILFVTLLSGPFRLRLKLSLSSLTATQQNSSSYGFARFLRAPLSRMHTLSHDVDPYPVEGSYLGKGGFKKP